MRRLFNSALVFLIMLRVSSYILTQYPGLRETVNIQHYFSKKNTKHTFRIESYSRHLFCIGETGRWESEDTENNFKIIE
jgi:hypothetical protein